MHHNDTLHFLHFYCRRLITIFTAPCTWNKNLICSVWGHTESPCRLCRKRHLLTLLAAESVRSGDDGGVSTRDYVRVHILWVLRPERNEGGHRCHFSNGSTLIPKFSHQQGDKLTVCGDDIKRLATCFERQDASAGGRQELYVGSLFLTPDTFAASRFWLNLSLVSALPKSLLLINPEKRRHWYCVLLVSIWGSPMIVSFFKLWTYILVCRWWRWRV